MKPDTVYIHPCTLDAKVETFIEACDTAKQACSSLNSYQHQSWLYYSQANYNPEEDEHWISEPPARNKFF